MCMGDERCDFQKWIKFYIQQICQFVVSPNRTEKTKEKKTCENETKQKITFHFSLIPYLIDDSLFHIYVLHTRHFPFSKSNWKTIEFCWFFFVSFNLKLQIEQFSVEINFLFKFISMICGTKYHFSYLLQRNIEMATAIMYTIDENGFSETVDDSRNFQTYTSLSLLLCVLSLLLWNRYRAMRVNTIQTSWLIVCFIIQVCTVYKMDQINVKQSTYIQIGKCNTTCND